jgi:putative tryptophan/tyrosine transport system substrate-binding protein
MGASALLGYGASIPEVGRRAAWSLDQLVMGATPADRPGEPPTPCARLMHLTTAQALGLTMPPDHLLQADEVIRGPRQDRITMSLLVLPCPG